MKKLFLIYLLLPLTFSVVAQKVDRTQAPEAGPAPSIKLGDYESFTLDNGLKVFVIENHKLPVVSWQVFVNNDPVFEKNKTGYIEMTGSLLKTGTTSKDKAQIDKEIDFIGARLSTSSRGVFASSLSKYNTNLLTILSDVLLNPTFPEEEFEKLKKQTISGLEANKSDPSAISRNVADVLRYGKDFPYGELTTKESIENISVSDCKNYYNTYFKPGISYLIIVGDITMADAEPLVKKYLGSWKNGDVEKHTYPMPEAPTNRRVVFVDKPGAVQSTIKITYPVDLKPGADDAIAASVMNTILGNGGFMARLIQDLREDHAYTYGAYSQLRTDKLVGYFSAGADVRNEVTDSSVVRFLYEMDKISTELVPEDELENAKSYRNGGFARSLESPQTIARFALNIERYNLPKDYYANYLAKLAAVTSQDVLNAAKKYIHPENAYIVVVGNKGEVADNLTQFASSGEVEFVDVYGDPKSNNKPIPEGLSAQTVLDNYLEVMGGKEILAAVTSSKTVMNTTMQGMPLQMTVITKDNDKFIQDMSSNGNSMQKVVINGDAGKISGMMGSKVMTPEEVKDNLDNAVLFSELIYDDTYQLKLIDIVDVNGKDAYNMEITKPDGSVINDYFDVESGLKVMHIEITETPNGPMVVSQIYDKYIDADGIKVPSVITLDQAGQIMELTIESVKYNPELDDSLFLIE